MQDPRRKWNGSDNDGEEDSGDKDDNDEIDGNEGGSEELHPPASTPIESRRVMHPNVNMWKIRIFHF